MWRRSCGDDADLLVAVQRQQAGQFAHQPADHACKHNVWPACEIQTGREATCCLQREGDVICYPHCYLALHVQRGSMVSAGREGCQLRALCLPACAAHGPLSPRPGGREAPGARALQQALEAGAHDADAWGRLPGTAGERRVWVKGCLETIWNCTGCPASLLAGWQW